MNCFLTGHQGSSAPTWRANWPRAGTVSRPWRGAGSDWRGMAGVDCERVGGRPFRKGPCWKRRCAGAIGVFTWRPVIIFGCVITGQCTRPTSRAPATCWKPPRAAGCRRIVYTSTVGCIGLPRQDQGEIVPGDETTPVSEAQMRNHYKRSKWRAEVVARELAAKGCPVVIVNPSAPIGPFDLKPTPTGKVVLDFLQGRMPAYLDTGLNWVSVRDVAAGEILAAEKGRIGGALHSG